MKTEPELEQIAHETMASVLRELRYDYSCAKWESDKAKKVILAALKQVRGPQPHECFYKREVARLNIIISALVSGNPEPSSASTVETQKALAKIQSLYATAIDESTWPKRRTQR